MKRPFLTLVEQKKSSQKHTQSNSTVMLLEGHARNTDSEKFYRSLNETDKIFPLDMRGAFLKWEKPRLIAGGIMALSTLFRTLGKQTPDLYQGVLHLFGWSTKYSAPEIKDSVLWVTHVAHPDYHHFSTR